MTSKSMTISNLLRLRESSDLRLTTQQRETLVCFLESALVDAEKTLQYAVAFADHLILHEDLCVSDQTVDDIRSRNWVNISDLTLLDMASHPTFLDRFGGQLLDELPAKWLPVFSSASFDSDVQFESGFLFASAMEPSSETDVSTSVNPLAVNYFPNASIDEWQDELPTSNRASRHAKVWRFCVAVAAVVLICFVGISFLTDKDTTTAGTNVKEIEQLLAQVDDRLQTASSKQDLPQSDWKTCRDAILDCQNDPGSLFALLDDGDQKKVAIALRYSEDTSDKDIETQISWLAALLAESECEEVRKEAVVGLGTLSGKTPTESLVALNSVLHVLSSSNEECAIVRRAAATHAGSFFDESSFQRIVDELLMSVSKDADLETAALAAASLARLDALANAGCRKIVFTRLESEVAKKDSDEFLIEELIGLLEGVSKLTRHERESLEQIELNFQQMDQ